MNFSILQGESKFAAKNYHIGDFRLENIPPMPKGHYEVKLEFMINESGVLTATAEC